MRKVFLTLLVAALFASTLALRTPAEWANSNRRIYQVVTDRFATTDSSEPTCDDLHKYCGGTWAGLRKRLPYIKALGFNAIWISPTTQQVPGDATYHGYHTGKFTADSVNEHFGTEKDLMDLIKAAHRLDIWVMVDVVFNHAGPVDYDAANPYEGVIPFNDPSFYHDCNGCPDDCQIAHWDNDDEVEHCRLAGLPDLDQQNPMVRKTLIEWALDTAERLDIDGYRIDTVKEVAKDFWAELHDKLGCYTIGELFDGSWEMLIEWMKDGHYPALFSYPLFFDVQNSFMRGASLRNVRKSFDLMIEKFWEQGLTTHHQMSPFTSNHDNSRLMGVKKDTWAAINAIVMTLTQDGIPTVYYGEEQGFTGTGDPTCREPMWYSHFSRSTPQFKAIAAVNGVRDRFPKAFSPESPMHWGWTDDRLLSYYRDEVTVILTNVGENGSDVPVDLPPTSHGFKAGERVCNVIEGDCINVNDDGHLVTALLHGEAKVYVPQ